MRGVFKTVEIACAARGRSAYARFFLAKGADFPCPLRASLYADRKRCD